MHSSFLSCAVLATPGIESPYSTFPCQPEATAKDALGQRFSNFFQVGTTYISQNVLRTTFISQNVLRTTFISQNVLRTTLLLGLSNSLGLP